MKSITKTYKKGDFIKRAIDKKWFEARGYQVTNEEETEGFSGGKAFFYFLLFPPLALFGRSKKIKITYSK